ncbi:MAG: hypothetical protein ACRDJ9_34000, partial [Dehalococcoidia bacterium]
LGDQATAKLAATGLRGHAAAVQKINHIMPGVVYWELEQDKLAIVNQDAAAEARSSMNKIWKDTDPS